MRFTILPFAIALVLVLAGLSLSQNKTIVLIRHGEKDATAADQNDPPLSAAGKERAERAAKRIGKFRPGAIYSTNFLRTRQTVEPLARKRNKTIETYEPAKAKDLIAAILASKTKRFVIVGHSNTVDDLVNALMNQKLMSDLPDSEYGYLYVVTKKGNKFTYQKLPYTDKGSN